MSFWKFWGKKSKAKDDLDIRKEENDPEAEKRKLRHSLSISRSGRFKQKKRDRGGILDRPELYHTDQGLGEPEHSGFSETSSSASTTSTTSDMSNNSATQPPTQSSSSSRPVLNQQMFGPPSQANRRAGHTMPHS